MLDRFNLGFIAVFTHDILGKVLCIEQKIGPKIRHKLSFFFLKVFYTGGIKFKVLIELPIMSF